MTKLCEGACQCDPRLFRNKIVECISKEDCLKCRGRHEYFSCRGACDNVCATLMKMNQTNCPFINKKCNPMCYCESGYARNSNKICIPIDKCQRTVRPIENENIPQGNTKFSIKFVYELVKGNPDMNYIVSPLLVTFPLALLALYTTGPSHVQLLTVLSVNNNTEIRSTFMNLLKKIKIHEDELVLASGVFTDIRYEFSNVFIRDSKDVIDAKSQNLDFSKSFQSAATINTFVESHTNGTIKNIVTPDMLTELTRLVLVNTIYHKGVWQYKFNDKDTKKRDFFIDYNRSIPIDFMNQKVKAKYAQCPGLGAKVLELPYSGENFKFNLFLPDTIGSKPLLGLISKLFHNSDMLSECLNNLSFELLEIHIPKFNTETSVNLIELLKKLNVSSIFDARNSGITGILKKTQDLYVTDAVQKSLIIVNEKGSQASAANAVVIGGRSLPMPPIDYITFDANRPFFYLIKLQDLIVFWGTKVQ